MKTKKYTLLLILASLFVGCEDYLDKIDNIEALTELDIFTDVNLAEDYLDAGYTYLITETTAKSNQPDILSGLVMSDEGYPGRYNNSVQERYQSYANGDYLFLMDLNLGVQQRDTPNLAVRYSESWKGIRVVNTFLENVDLIENADEETINGLVGQAYFLRAFYYHLLTKRHGGVIYLTENLDLNSDLARVRESYESNLENILIDLEQAIDLLPVNWTAGNIGRPTKGAAMALKSRVTLFAASPLANTNNDPQKWVDAATAASDLINYASQNGLYQLIDASDAINLDVGHGGADLFVSEPEKLNNYRKVFVGPGKSKVLPQEAIFMEVNDNTIGNGGLVPLPRTYLTSGYDIVKGNFNPMNIGATANFVEKFETKNGLAIEDDPSYNDQEPFINRDPRFYNAILYDGVPWIVTDSAPLNTSGVADLAVINENGVLGVDLHDPTSPANQLWRVRNSTGYRIRKWVPNGFFLRNCCNAEEDFYVNNMIFRMSEIYLNYAEAANEAYGPAGKAPGQSLSSLDAVNVIRNRVGMPNVNGMYTGSTSTLRERIRNERAIEFCFEAMRYDDIRRWKIAHLEENKKVEFLEMRWQGGVSAIYPTGFSFENVEQVNLKKTFIEKNYWWPIPSSELEAVPDFGQTDNW
ncbi:RagB/SusD family nutrient uptake outer membrane protein [Flavivirga jejuensis]|uniref:RagB/SusD family nutrient uptake outer membrane protein n=1 Tax=Flavivirga jejuensis TaxID=870487 RepID=A0ABT8WJY3_9FLAO|nr:RagB/SusD family nutrient uptake outer membrane protein [Flavivirga jejuensis]MDO5973470.1 RagB/SusD family nutrient uptake outer membrane protein [Flavivirga jejuensis]